VLAQARENIAAKITDAMIFGRSGEAIVIVRYSVFVIFLKKNRQAPSSEKQENSIGKTVMKTP